MPRSGRTKILCEKELLVRCARTCVDEQNVRRIRQLLGGPLDWKYLLKEAANHSLRPLVERNLRPFAGMIPSEAVADLNQSCRANALKSLMFSGELCKILENFRDLGIGAISYKGPVLAVQAYGDAALREFGDVDIILRQRDIDAAHGAMCALGYRPRFPWIHTEEMKRRFVPGEYAYIGPRNALVELHTEVTLRHFPSPPNLDDVFARAITVPLDGRQVPALSSADLLSFLSVHGSKDLWERIGWVVDIAELLRNTPNFDWDQAMRLARESRLQRMVCLAIVLAQDLCQLEISVAIQRAIEADVVAQRLANEIGNGLLDRNLPQRNAVKRFRIRAQMVDGALAGFRYAMRLTTTPAEEDLDATGTPAALSPLHSFLRPVRLVRKFRAVESVPRQPIA